MSFFVGFGDFSVCVFSSSVAIRLISLGIHVAAVSAHFPRGAKPSAEVTETTEMLLCRVLCSLGGAEKAPTDGLVLERPWPPRSCQTGVHRPLGLEAFLALRSLAKTLPLTI